MSTSRWKSRLIALGRHSQDRITSLNNSFIGSINRQAKVVVLEDIDCLDPPAHNSSEVTALSLFLADLLEKQHHLGELKKPQRYLVIGTAKSLKK